MGEYKTRNPEILVIMDDSEKGYLLKNYKIIDEVF